MAHPPAVLPAKAATQLCRPLAQRYDRISFQLSVHWASPQNCLENLRSELGLRDLRPRCPLQAKAALVQVQEAIQENTPEELTPLVEALDRAKRQQEEATGIREALEAEVEWNPSFMRSPLPAYCLGNIHSHL